MVESTDLRLSMFLPLVGELFEVCEPDCREELRLVAAHEMPDFAGLEHRAGAFCLAFQGVRKDHVLQQGSRHLRHAALGEFEMVIAPRARLPEGTIRYTALLS